MQATEKEYAVKATAVQEAERALSDKELQLAKLMGELDKRSASPMPRRLKSSRSSQVEAMKIQLDGAGNELKAVEDNRDAERALSDEGSQLAKLIGNSEERSSLAEVQKTEIIALKTQVEAMKERLDGANNELKAVEDRSSDSPISLASCDSLSNNARSASRLSSTAFNSLPAPSSCIFIASTEVLSVMISISWASARGSPLVQLVPSAWRAAIPCRTRRARLPAQRWL